MGRLIDIEEDGLRSNCWKFVRLFRDNYITFSTEINEYGSLVIATKPYKAMHLVACGACICIPISIGLVFYASPLLGLLFFLSLCTSVGLACWIAGVNGLFESKKVGEVTEHGEVLLDWSKQKYCLADSNHNILTFLTEEGDQAILHALVANVENKHFVVACSANSRNLRQLLLSIDQTRH